MKFIKPLQISGAIMTLIEEAAEHVVLISPYYKFTRWRKFNEVVRRAMDRQVKMDFFVRENEWECIEEVRALGIVPKEIFRLHAKLYFNEKEAIISSMNLNQSSDDASLDLALITETDEEYAQVIRFYEQYILPRAKQNDTVDVNKWLDQLDTRLCKIFKREPFLDLADDGLEIQGDNVYTVFIDDAAKALRLNCVLSEREREYLEQNSGDISLDLLKIEVIKGNGKSYSMIWGTLPDAKSVSLEKLQSAEADMYLDIISVFAREVERVKAVVREKRKEK